MDERRGVNRYKRNTNIGLGIMLILAILTWTAAAYYVLVGSWPWG